MKIDSVDKIVTQYFAAITRERFRYKDVTYNPQPLRVSEKIFRGYVCPEGCGACCPRFSLDYLPHESAPSTVRERWVVFNQREVKLLSDMQGDHDSYHCRHVRTSDGRCSIHHLADGPGQPFSCDFEILRFTLTRDTEKNNRLCQQLFPRGWNMKRATDGERGALCYMTEPSPEAVADVVRRLKRLRDWCDHFKLDTVIHDILAYAKTGPHSQPLYLNQEFATGHDKRIPLPLR